MNKKAFLKYLLALFLFGSNGIVASFIDLNSMEIVLLRTLIGSAFLIILFFMTGSKLTFHRHKKESVFLAASGIAMGMSWMLLYEAYARIGVSISSLLYYCGPVIVMALSPLLFKEKLTSNSIVGFIAVIIGIVLINLTAFDGNSDIGGIFCGISSAVMYALMVICNKKTKKISGLENACLQLAVAFLTVSVFTGLKQGYTIQISSHSILPIFILGMLNTGIGCYLYFSSIGKLKMQTVAICGYLEPLSAVFFSTVFLDEKMLCSQLIGGSLIILGAITSELSDINKKRGR